MLGETLASILPFSKLEPNPPVKQSVIFGDVDNNIDSNNESI